MVTPAPKSPRKPRSSTTTAKSAAKPVTKSTTPKAEKIIKPKPITSTATLKEHAETLKTSATDKARGVAQDGINKATNLLDDVAATVHDSAKSVDARFGTAYGDYARKAASAVSGAAASVKGKEVEELLDAASGFVKKKPLLAAGAAAAIGFALVRLFRAGSDDEKND